MQVLVEVAALQPSIRQKEIADRVGVTPQAVSEHIKELTIDGSITCDKRGRYEVTKAGIELIIEWTNELNSYIRYISEDVVGKVTVWTAIAQDDLNARSPVSLAMREGILYAASSTASDSAQLASGVTIGSARQGDDVGVENLQGIIPMDRARVTVAIVPRIQRGGSAAVDLKQLRRIAADKPVAVLGLEALVSARKAGIAPFMQYGIVEGVTEAAFRGLSTVVVAVDELVPSLVARLISHDVPHDTVELSTGH